MSVKSKVKRCNKEIRRQEIVIENLETEKNRLEHNFKRVSEDYTRDLEKLKLYENIIKFALTNQIGGLEGGMRIDWFGIDKMQSLQLNVENDPYTNGYIIQVRYRR